MTDVLHIDSSALGEGSVSRKLSADAVRALRSADPTLTVRYRDLAAAPLPHWLPAGAADPACGPHDAAVLEEFLAADVIVLGAPMYNFTVSSQLKAWVDRILVAGRTFRYGPNGPEGLAGGKRVIVASSRGGIYSDGPRVPLDFQEPYLRSVFGFIGITDIQTVRAEGLAMGDEQRSRALDAADDGIRRLLAKAA